MKEVTKMKRLKEVIEHDKENVSLVQRQSMQRTSWDGLILIGVSLVALLVQSLVMYAAVAGILWGIYTIIKDQAYD